MTTSRRAAISALAKELSKEARSLDDLCGKDNLLSGLFKDTVEEMLKAELTNHVGYPKHHALGDLSGNNRNGMSTKKLRTSHGETEIEIPRDRNGTYEPQIVKKYQTSSNEIEDKVVCMYARGMTTRDIEKQLEEMYGIETSPALISDITNKILPLVAEWQSRPLSPVYPLIFLDAIHFKVREEGKILSKAAYIVLGIDIHGRNDILGIWIGGNEGAHFWLSVLTDLKNRGVEDILIASCDGLKGFPEAIRSIFPHTEIQLCVVHQIRNSLKYIASKYQKEFLKDLKQVYRAPTKESAEEALLELGEKWGDRYPLVIRSWEANWEHLSTYFKYPPQLRKLIYTTNRLENFNRGLRKVTKNRSLFPSDESLRKLLWLATRDIVQKWNKPIPNWGEIISQFAIHFDGRLQLDLLQNPSFTQNS